MIDFFNQLNVSERTKHNYESALNSGFIKESLLLVSDKKIKPHKK